MRLGPPFPLGNVVILVISGMIRQHTIGSMGVYRGGCGASPPQKERKAGNPLMDWDNEIVPDWNTSQPFHAKAVRGPILSLAAPDTRAEHRAIDYHYFTTASPHTALGPVYLQTSV